MIKVKVSELKGKEILAKHLLTDSGYELISAGTLLKYIQKIKELGISEVYVYEVQTKNKEQKDLIEEVVKEESVKLVKDVLEKHIYKNSSDISELCGVADEIIDKVLEEKLLLDELFV